MASRKIIDYIRSLGGNFRGDCPVCYNAHTFVANEVNGFVVYYCFHANCKLKGKIEHVLSIDTIKYKPDERINSGQYKVPGYFGSPLQNNGCYNFLNRYDLIDFYAKHTNLIKYDPKQNRCVFLLIDDKGECHGATGRSLTFSSSPRWFIYERINSFLYTIAPNRTTEVVLVEDCVSASVASSYVNCAALLGTNIPDESIQHLIKYDKLFIALDPDALSKSIILQRKLSAYKPTEIISIDKDLKYFNKHELQELKKYVEDS